MTQYKITPHLHDSIVASQVSQIFPDHAWSHAELEITARLQQINPKNGILSLPFSIGPFALARIDSPLFKKSIGREVYIKVTNVAESQFAVNNPQYSHTAEFIISDVDLGERRRLAHTLLATATDYFAKNFGSERKIASTNEKIETKEINSKLTNVVPEPLFPQPGVAVDPTPVVPPVLEQDVPQKKAPVTDDDFTIRIDLKKHIDPVIVKAMIVFALAAGVMVLVIYAATHVDESSYKDHGKEYGEFFKRMKDPDYSRKNPAKDLREPKQDDGENP